MLKKLFTKTQLAREMRQDPREVHKLIESKKLKPVAQDAKGRLLFAQPK